MDWLLALGLKEGQVKTVCITSWVILIPLSKKQELYRRRDEILLDGYNTFRCQIDEPTFMKFTQNNHPTRLFGPTCLIGT